MAKTLEEIFEYAIKRQNEEEEYAEKSGDYLCVLYWSAYADGVRACIRSRDLNIDKELIIYKTALCMAEECGFGLDNIVTSEEDYSEFEKSLTGEESYIDIIFKYVEHLIDTNQIGNHSKETDSRSKAVR